MTRSHMQTTEWFYHSEDSLELRTRFSYGYKYIKGNEDAYISLTHETQRKTRYGFGEDFFGAPSKHLVRTLAPNLLPLCDWQLSSVVTGPMHYVKNALYWWDMIHGRDQLTRWYNPKGLNTLPSEAKGYLISHINYGAVDTDELHDPMLMTREQFEG